MTTTAKRYFILAVCFEASDTFSVQFGDYDREVVAQERADAYEDAYATRIVCTKDDQASMDRAIAKLNA